MPCRIAPKAESLEMNTTAPPPPSRIGPSTAWVQAMAVNRFTSMVRCHRARSVWSAKNPGWLQPALLTSTSTPPQALTAWPATAAAASGSVRSAAAARASAAPARLASSATASACGPSMSATSTRAPSAAKPRAMPRPMFAPPPVTMTRASRCPRSIRSAPRAVV